MAYTTPQRVADTYPKTFTASFTAEQLRMLIGDADALINARLAARYFVPFASYAATPPVIEFLSRVLAVADVLDRSQTAPDWITRRIDRAYEILGLIATGDMILVDASGTKIPLRTDMGRPQSTTESYIPTFGVAPSITETVDPIRADDENNARR